MFGLGMSEVIFLAILALIVIGPKELPQLARTLGRFLNELKRSANVLGDELKQQTFIEKIDFNDRPYVPPKTNYPEQVDEAQNPQQLELVEQGSLEKKKEEQKGS